LEKSLGTKKRNLDELQQRLLGLNEDIQKSDIVGVSEREASRSALKIKLKEIVGKKSTEENEKVVLESRKCKIMDDIHKVSSKNIIARKFLLRRDVALQAAEELKEIKQLKENEVRQYIEKEVNVILQKYARRDYKFVLDVNYRMMLVNRTGGMAPKSSGENQLVSLAFLSALISFAKKRIKEQKGSGVYIPATLAPLVLDSPFGQLDKTYRSTVADFVSRLAPQVIILVSSSQGNSEVIESLENRIGAEYVLVHHDRSTQGTKKQDVVHRYGKEYVTSFYDEPCSMTVIKRIDA
jgi:DNA sulfur modification protein DndD